MFLCLMRNAYEKEVETIPLNTMFSNSKYLIDVNKEHRLFLDL